MSLHYSLNDQTNGNLIIFVNAEQGVKSISERRVPSMFRDQQDRVNKAAKRYKLIYFSHRQ